MTAREQFRRLRRRLAPVAAVFWALLSLALFSHAASIALGNIGARWGTFTATSEGSCGRGGCVYDGTWVGNDGARMDFAEMQKDGLAPGVTARAARPSVDSPVMPSTVYSPWRLRLEPLMWGFFGLIMAGVSRSTWRQRRWNDGFDGGRHAPADYRPRHGLGATLAVSPEEAHAQSGDSPFSR